ncbi:MAG TPA: hypothetical protein VH417_01130 [Vicinamibacterales bacterium]
MEEVLIVSVLFPTIFGSMVWIVYLIVSAIRARQQTRLSTEFHAKLLERIGSARELGELLNTEGGRNLLETLVVDRTPAPQQRILRAAQSGTVLVTVGIGVWLALMVAVRDWPRGVGSGVFVIASVIVATGAGLLLSAKVSHSISRNLGLLERSDPSRTTALH